MFTVEHVFLAGLGLDIAGAYLVSRGLLAPVPQLAKRGGGTMWALQTPGAPYAVEDRIRGTVGLVALVSGFVLQAIGYALVLSDTPVDHGAEEVVLGIAITLGLASLVLIGERFARPRWRDRLLVRVASVGTDTQPMERPFAHVLRALGTETSRPQLADESDVEYCRRVFKSKRHHMTRSAALPPRGVLCGSERAQM
jgi:hypothetical protein